MYIHTKQYITDGLPLNEAKKAIIMIHGRGADAAGMVSLKKHLPLADMAIIAPQATNHSWYPYSFMAPDEDNQPALDSALNLIGEIVDDVKARGISPENIYFLGFSQGACLSLEYVARNAQPYGGVIALTGGLIGQQLKPGNYKGDFAGTRIFVSTNNPDPHVPVERVEASIDILKNLHADTQLKIYDGRPHTITADELALAAAFVFQ